MEEIPSYEKFCEQRGLDQTKPESREKYKLYREAAEYMEFDILMGFVSGEE